MNEKALAYLERCGWDNVTRVISVNRVGELYEIEFEVAEDYEVDEYTCFTGYNTLGVFADEEDLK